MSKALLEKINQSTPELIRNMTLEERYESVVNEAIKVVGASHGTIFLFENGEFKRVYSNVPKKYRFIPRKNGYTAKTFKSGNARVMSPKILAKAHGAFYQKGIQSVVLIPLATEAFKIGVLTLQMHKSYQIDELKMQALNLFGKIITLAIKNSQYWEELENSIKTRDLFISLASHELRTPLTTILVYLDQFDKKLKTRQPISHKKVEIALSEAKRLKNIINELLAFDQILKGQLNYIWQNVSIVKVLNRSLANFSAAHPKFKAIVDNKLPKSSTIIRGDPEKIQQVFTNLLNNSAKFSSSYTPILIEMTSNDSKIKISFSDYGKGMRKAEQKKVFKEFYKERGNNMPGMGLGLYLVKEIVEQHKGEIEVISQLHKGSTFVIKLPIKNV